MKKRIVSLVAVLAMICQLFAAGTVYAGKVEELPENSYVLKEEFNTANKNARATNHIIATHIVDSSGNGMMQLENPGNGPGTAGRGYYFYPDVRMSPDENVVSVSLDFMVETLDYYGQIVIAGSGGERVVFPLMEDGRMSVDRSYIEKPIEPTNGGIVTNYQAGKWHTLTLAVDKEQKKFSFFLDGVGFGTLFYKNEWGDVISLRIDRNSKAKGLKNTMYVDNFVFGYEDAIPIYKEDCNITLICEELGQAFFTRDVEFDVMVENTTETKNLYDVSVELVSDIKTTDFAKTEAVELAPGESKKISYKAKLSRYGVYELFIKAADKKSGEVFEKKSQFVTLRKVEIQNPQIGICDHTALKGDGYARANEKMAFLRNTGMIGIRDMPQWVDYEKTVGVYKLPDNFKKTYEAAKANGLDVYQIAGMHNYLVAPGERPPESKTGIEGFGRYANHLAQDTVEYGTGYEIYNEWNIESFNLNWLPPEAYVPLIKEAYKQIKAANLNAKVYGLSGLSLARPTYLEYAERMFAAGVGDYSDGFTVHPYDHTDGPDNGKHMDGIIEIRKIMEKYGQGHKDLYITETGWQTVSYKPATIAQYVVKYSTMTYDLVDRIYWYVSQQKINVVEGERTFGWMMDANEYADYVPYAPQEQFIAIANYNHHMANAESKGMVKLENSNAIMYRFKKADGKDLIIAWAKERCDRENIVLDLGTKSVTVEDMYGNGEEISTVDGKLHLTLDENPRYIVGDFGKTDIKAEKSEFLLNTHNLTVVANDFAEIYVTKDNAVKNAEVQFDLPDNIEIAENKGFSNGRANVLFKTGGSPKDDAVVKVKVVDKKTQKPYYTAEVKLTYSPAIAIDAVPKMLGDNRWQISLLMTNMKFKNPVSGVVKMKSPEFAKQLNSQFRLEKVIPGSTFIKNIYAPDYWETQRNTVECEIILDTGEKLLVEATVNLNGIIRTTKPPTIDGVITEGEWDKRMPVTLNKESQLMETTDWWEGPDDLSAELYYNWDRANLYVAAEVTDDIMCDSSKYLYWENDGIQLAFAPEKVKNGERSEFAIGLKDGETYFDRTAQMLHNADGLNQKTDFNDFEGVEAKVTRKDTKTYYEMKIPWEVVAYDGFEIGSFESIYMSALLNENDGTGRLGWLEFCGGIGIGKNAVKFERVKVFR